MSYIYIYDISSLRVKEAAVSIGLVINDRITKYMKSNRNTTNLEQELIMNGQVFERVQSFSY